MKKILSKSYITLFFLFATFILFAQPGTGSPDGLEEPDAAPAAPIDNYILLLAIVAIIFAFMRFRAIQANKT